ncbi:MAG TPA: ArsR family transcriptional regulator [Acidimicrobiales bacterium]|nr:ArsR family transcriptional regulator [Acidimicrobiales bacterium]
MTTSTTDVSVAAKLFRGLGDPTRLSILLALVERELRVTDLVAELGGSQGNISGHVGCLRECGLIVARPEGRQTFYRVAGPEIVSLLRAGETVLARTGTEVTLCPNYVNEQGPSDG